MGVTDRDTWEANADMPADRHEAGPSEPDDEHQTVADAFAPPVPPSKATRSTFMLGVLGVVAVALAVFVLALALR